MQKASLTLLCLFFICGTIFAGKYSWDSAPAEVLPSGDLKWKPEKFVYMPGKSIRYIDYETGKDSNDGSKQSPWQHHPWDKSFKGNAAGANGVDTYVFRGGVTYRGRISIPEGTGTVRLTTDPSWGKGRAVIAGSEVVKNWKKGADHKDIPDGKNVWYTDLNYLPRNVWMSQGGKVTRIPLARTPNWTIKNYDDIKSEWFEWNNPGKHFGMKKGKEHIAYDTVNINKPEDYYKKAILWTEWGWVMGTPYPVTVGSVDVKKKLMTFRGIWGGPSGVIIRHNRYYLEDKPHYLDDPNGEFWFDRKGRTQKGRLYIRLPEGADPNKVTIEAARQITLIDATKVGKLEISGIAFRFTNVFWKLDALPLDIFGPDVDGGVIRFRGSADRIAITNCLFEHVNMPASIASGDGGVVKSVSFNDNILNRTDYGGVWFNGGKHQALQDVEVLRNQLSMIGMRPNRYGQGHALEIRFAQRLEVAGNFLDKCWGSGIFIYGGKDSKADTDCPLSRILVHHNKVTDAILNTCDWGGIETWQGGPAYVYNNISGNPGGYWNWKHKLSPNEPSNARFGFAFYLDGAFKNYHFNNIAWGKSNDPTGALGNTAAFQEIHSYQNTFFNNTVWNFLVASRRQGPQAGRDKFLSNIFEDISVRAFRHSDSTKQANDRDVGDKKSNYAYETNAYDDNLFYQVAELGIADEGGAKYKSISDYSKALSTRGSLGTGVGEAVKTDLLSNPKQHDFRLKPNSPAVDKGAKVFVPWSLYAMVGEWNFYPAGNDATRILDEHWYMAPYYLNRQKYHEMPMFPLKGVNITKADYVKGNLEDWTNGALRFNGKDQYAVLKNAALGFPKEESVEKPLPVKSFDWIKLDLPEKIVPGQKLEIKAKLLKAPAQGVLRLDMHWAPKNGRGGLNCMAKGIKVKGPGVYTFTVTPKAKPNLHQYSVIAYLGPDGNWKSKTHTARQEVLAAAAGAGLDSSSIRSPQVKKDSFLIETYFKLQPAAKGGVLMEKMQKSGYSLTVTPDGQLQFDVKGSTGVGSLKSNVKVNDGKWHHVIAECDRPGRKLTLYIDGRGDSSGSGIDANASLENPADVYVAGTPNGKCLPVIMDFLRISLGTLADAKTTIDELYTWQFNGPFLKDFTGAKPTGKRRDAGALEAR